MKTNKTIITLLITVIFSFTLLTYINTHTKNQIQQNISNKLIRIHVIGNSNTAFDQKIKLRIKDAVIKEITPSLSNVHNINTAHTIINNKLTTINDIVVKELAYNHIFYPVKTTLSKRFFPEKTYANITLPKGEYNALCIELGHASGKNWWSILYPSLTFVDYTYNVISEKSKQNIEQNLTSSEYNYITTHSNTTVKYKSYILDLLSKIQD